MDGKDEERREYQRRVKRKKKRKEKEQRVKMEIESLKKTQRETALKIENLGKRIGVSQMQALPTEKKRWKKESQ